MDKLINADTLKLLFEFVIPGFMAIRVHGSIFPVARRNWSDALIELVGYSLFNWLLWALLPWGLFAHVNLRNITDLDAPSALADIAYVFVTPAILSFAFYYLLWALRHPWVRKKLNAVNVYPLNGMPTAWEYFFDRRPGCYIRFHLKSGDVITGCYGSASFATLYPEPQQVYVEKIIREGDAGTRSLGGIISQEQCYFIEMFSVDEDPKKVSNDQQPNVQPEQIVVEEGRKSGAQAIDTPQFTNPPPLPDTSASPQPDGHEQMHNGVQPMQQEQSGEGSEPHGQ